MEKNTTNKKPEFLEYVYKLNEGIELSEALTLSLQKIDVVDIAQLNSIGFKTYEKRKWTVHKILQHLIDWERIWCYRAITFARKEGTIPEAQDQEIMGENSNADELSIEQLINELRLVRQSTIMMFDSFNKKILETNCAFFEYEMPLFAIGFTITAHQIHHFKIIQEKYIPLAKYITRWTLTRR
ncbi:MAG: DinB family protein [Chitinophagaceae bacterium]|nr:DinB family protein [Chitinophagaceae bacterium]